MICLLLCGLQKTGHLNTCRLLFQQVICYVSSSRLRETCTFCFTLISSSCCSCASLFVPELFHQGSCYFGLCLHHLHVSCTIMNLTDLWPEDQSIQCLRDYLNIHHGKYYLILVEVWDCKDCNSNFGEFGRLSRLIICKST